MFKVYLFESFFFWYKIYFSLIYEFILIISALTCDDVIWRTCINNLWRIYKLFWASFFFFFFSSKMLKIIWKTTYNIKIVWLQLFFVIHKVLKDQHLCYKQLCLCLYHKFLFMHALIICWHINLRLIIPSRKIYLRLIMYPHMWNKILKKKTQCKGK